MTIVLLILKWIGIILLSLLGILIVLLLSVLFVPVRYKVYGKYGEEVDYHFAVSWLFHIISVKMKSADQMIKLYLFGIPIRVLMGEKKEDSKKKESSKEDPKKEELKSSLSDKVEKEKNEEVSVTEQVKKIPKDVKPTKKSKKKKKAKKQKRKKKKNSFSFQKISSIIDFVRQPTSKKVIKLLWHEIIGVIRHIFPRRMKGSVVFGTGDPASTGMLIGVISMFPFAYDKSVQIQPDFEERVIEAQGQIKGRIYGVFFVRLAIRLYRNRQVKRFYYKLMKSTKGSSK